MTDKEKQIDETRCCYSCNHYNACNDCYTYTNGKDYFKTHIAHNREVAMWCKQYQPKIPEGSVVLSKEEYEDLRILEEKYGKPTYIDGSMTAYAHRLETANNLVNKSRKETAREILNAMLDIKPDFSLLDGCTPSEFMRSVDLATNIIFQAVKKQAERYDVEVKE